MSFTMKPYHTWQYDFKSTVFPGTLIMESFEQEWEMSEKFYYLILQGIPRDFWGLKKIIW